MLEYTKTDQIIHQLSQIVAKINRTYVPKNEDDSYTNFYYDPIENCILGRWVNSPKGVFLFGFQLSSFTFTWFDVHFHELKSYTIEGKTSESIEDEIANDLVTFGLDSLGFKNVLHFEISDYPFKYQTFGLLSEVGLEQWMHFRKKANVACLKVLGRLQQPGEIRIWPHHFDTGVYVVNQNELGISFGLAMEDDIASLPYFYITGYPNSGELQYSELPVLTAGNWVTEGEWKGAILTLDKLTNDDNDNILDSFIKDTLKWYLV